MREMMKSLLKSAFKFPLSPAPVPSAFRGRSFSALLFSLMVSLSLSPSQLLAQPVLEPEKKLAGQVQAWAEDLKVLRKDLNFSNFPELIDEVLCPHIERLQSAPYKFLSQDEKNPLLQEVVKTYGQVAEYSRDHNYFYCLYLYYKTPEADSLLKLSSAALSPTQQEALLYRMKSCHREETEGNGDLLPFHFDFNETKESHPNRLSDEDYKQLPYRFQKQYSNELREAILELEKSSPPPSLSPSPHKNFVLKFIPDWWAFLPLAFSDTNSTKCLIGGLLREINDRNRCPVWNNSCGEGDASFACGPIFNQECIPIKPFNNISSRCYEASKDHPISENSFEDLQEGLNQDVLEYCKDRTHRTACSLYSQRVKEIDEYYLLKLPEGGGYRKGLKEVGRGGTEADAFCLYGQCQKTPYTTNIETFEDTVKMMNLELSKEAEPLTVGMSSYLTDLVAKNATCNCNGNTPCIRGCERGTSSADTHHRCRGTRQETGYCMRYVNAALMRTIDVFLEPYCSFDKPSCYHHACIHQECRGALDLNSCDKCSNIPEQPRGICNQSLSLPHALCALNLDGKDRLGVNNGKKIDIDSSVFQSCKNVEAEGEHNTALKSILVDGKDQPLFIESETARFKPETEQGTEQGTKELDLTSLKDGDIVVMKSRSRSGHIEVKVPREKCEQEGPGVCFCSDFCELREEYTGSFKPQVVFQFNPKVTRHLESLKQRSK